LTNPAGATRQLLGVSDRTYQETIAEALLALGCERALVVSAEDGLDEISISGPTRIVEVVDGKTSEWFVAPADVGLAETPLEAIAGGSPEENAAVIEAVLEGEDGPARDVVVMTAGAAILAGGAASDLGDGMDRAREAIDRGAARGVLDKLRSLASASG
jgi:anthranilate phosphoribosyltransferase